MALDDLRSALLEPDDAARGIPADQRRAAVALALREESAGVEVLLMLRAERANDRWSGQVSLPGGHAEDGDVDLVATAVRETREEVGLDLIGDANLLGALAPVRARARGKPVHTTIAPLVFALTAPPELRLGPEASDSFWLPLDRVASGELDGEYRYEREDRTIVMLPCWHFEERIVWGLTHGILRDFLQLAGGALGP